MSVNTSDVTTVDFKEKNNEGQNSDEYLEPYLLEISHNLISKVCECHVMAECSCEGGGAAGRSTVSTQYSLSVSHHQKKAACFTFKR